MIGLPALKAEEKAYAPSNDRRRLLPHKQRGQQFYKALLTETGVLSAWMLTGSTGPPTPQGHKKATRDRHLYGYLGLSYA